MASKFDEIMIIEQLGDRLEYSPDISELRKQKEHVVFIYDKLKPRVGVHLGNGFLLKDLGARYLGEARTAFPNFDMKITKDTRDPIVLLDNKRGYFIKGDAFAIDTHGIMALDKFYNNLVSFKRNRTSFVLIDQVALVSTPNKRPIVPGFMYIAENIKDRNNLTHCTSFGPSERMGMSRHGYHVYY